MLAKPGAGRGGGDRGEGGEGGRGTRDQGSKLLTVVSSEVDLEEDEGGGGGGGGKSGGGRSTESLELVLTGRGARAEDLLPHGWPELARLLIAERFRIPLETYFDAMAEVSEAGWLWL